jgi:hypothetical protein
VDQGVSAALHYYRCLVEGARLGCRTIGGLLEMVSLGRTGTFGKLSFTNLPLLDISIGVQLGRFFKCDMH